jgi:hypothetical protein
MPDTLNSYYPSKDSNTYYAMYSPPIERFILVEKYNSNVFLQTGYVLSSKIAVIIFILPEKEKHPVMTNKTCLLFSLNHTRYNPEANVNAMRSVPTVSMLKHNKIIKIRESQDFAIGKKQQILSKLQSYAIFCQSCLHAINLASMLHQHTWTQIKNEQYYYNNLFFEAKEEENRIKKNDVEQIMNILFFSEDKEQALKNIKNFWSTKIELDINDRIFWKEKSRSDLLNYIILFYNTLGEETPKDLKI